MLRGARPSVFLRKKTRDYEIFELDKGRSDVIKYLSYFKLHTAFEVSMRKITKKVIVLLVAVSVLAFSTQAKAAATDAMSNTLTDALYGGAIGALVGTAVLFLTDKPGDHIDYIFTGAGIGILGGVAYGLATSGVVQRAATEYDGEKVTFSMPTIKRTEVYDELLSKKEVINSVDLFKLRF